MCFGSELFMRWKTDFFSILIHCKSHADTEFFVLEPDCLASWRRPIARNSRFRSSTLFIFVKEISLKLEEIRQGTLLGNCISFKSNRELCKVELVPLNRSDHTTL